MLSATRVAVGEVTERSLVLLHGIYGRGRNWQGIARSVVAARPEYDCWLVDLPHHGDSSAGAHGDTVAGLARDLREWMAEARIAPTAILGHSFGGKVALAVAAAARNVALQIWVIDSTPEVKPPSGSAWGMLEVVRRLPPRFPTRETAVDHLIDAGYSRGVAQWMASNLARESSTDAGAQESTADRGEFVWRLDFAAMERLLLDFFQTDLWSAVISPGDRHDIHFLKASESHAISEEAVKRIEAADSARVHMHHRQGGHWIHAESPAVVVDLLVECLP
jgi:esterase